MPLKEISSAEVTLPTILSDNMVHQLDTTFMLLCKNTNKPIHQAYNKIYAKINNFDAFTG